MKSKIMLLLICLMGLAGGAQASSVAVYEEPYPKFSLHDNQEAGHFKKLSDDISNKPEKDDKKINVLPDKKEREWEREKFCHPSTPVPVPASIVLFVSGLLGMTTVLYRKRPLSARNRAQ